MAKVTQTKTLYFLRANACAIGEDRLGFYPVEIGNTLVWYGAVMDCFLYGVRETRITMIVQWKTIIFLHCLRKQTLEFYQGMTTNLLRHEYFHALLAPVRWYLLQASSNSMVHPYFNASRPTFNL